MDHVLVAYASKRGSTAEIADAIATALRRSGLVVDCKPVHDVGSLADYDALVLGSAVYMKRWQGDAKHFLRKHADELTELPFWVFSSGPVGDPDKSSDPSWLEPPRIIDRATQMGVRGHVVFGGRVPAEPRGPIERSMVKNTPEAYRDRRDWDEIHRWAEQVACELQTAVPAAG
jgi:menaquinone-dependent protoporphyrinogen oxidase